MATTPPIQIVEQTPPTPLYGAKYDSNRLRKSTRQSSTRNQRANQTPPPHSHKSTEHPSSLNLKKATALRTEAHTYSPPSSTHTSPRKKIGKDRKQTSERNNTMNGHDQFHDPLPNPSLQQPSLNLAAGMLPTPAKTPRKKPIHPAAVNGAARVLFPIHQPDPAEDAMPNPRKKRSRRHVGFSLYSSMEDDGDASSEGKIQIYTDSKDKVPELDLHEDNPFLERPVEHSPPPEPSKPRISKKRKAEAISKNRKEVTEALDHDEGMVYVFRGKKIYRKFPDDNNDDDMEEDTRSLTRSSIKPRLLFPTPQQRREREAANVSDEEATTEVEDIQDEPEIEVTTPVKQTVFSPATPPTTGHATRSSTKITEDVKAIPFSKERKISPFDGWARRKASAGPGGGEKSKKRQVEIHDSVDGDGQHKRVKGNGSV